MEMRDRLIDVLNRLFDYHITDPYEIPDVSDFADDLLANGAVVLDTGVISPKNRPLITHFADMPINDVLDLVRAKREGRIIVPPCEVGDTVYQVYYGGGIREETIIRISIDLERCEPQSIKCDTLFSVNNCVYGSFFDCDCFGKTVFLTKEEAEKALKEREGNG